MLHRLLISRADRYPEKIAVACGTEHLTYRELAAQVDALARRLASLGISPQDRVAVVLPDGEAFIVALFAVLRLRAVALPLACSSSGSELSARFGNAAPRIVITDEERASSCRQALRALGSGAMLITAGNLPAAGDLPGETTGVLPDLEPPFEGKALYLYSSGSEGTPKRVCRSQRGLLSEGLNFVASLSLGPEDHTLCLVPLCHSYGLGNGLLAPLAAGATLVIPPPPSRDLRTDVTPSPGFAERIAALIAGYDVRILVAVTYQYDLMAGFPDAAIDRLRRLKHCFSSGTVLTPELFERFRSRCGLAIRSIFGSTEMGTVCVSRSASVDPRTVGPPVDNVEVRILDDEERQLPPETAGNIWVKSAVLPDTGYDDEPDLNSRVFRNGHFRSGDIGKLDALGNLTLVGRKEVVIESGGHKISSREVEDVLRSHPAVREAAVIGVDFPEIGGLVYAFVVPDTDLKEADLRDFCRSRMAFYKVPHRIELLSALPRNTLGKVLKDRLQLAARQTDAKADRGPSPEPLPRGARGVSRERLFAASPEARNRMLTEYLRRNLADLLEHPIGRIDPDTALEAAGMKSITSVKLARQLSDDFELPLSPTFILNHPTIGQMVRGLLAELSPSRDEKSAEGWGLATPARKKDRKLEALLDEIEAEAGI